MVDRNGGALIESPKASNGFLTSAMTANDVVAQVQLVQSVMGSVMKDGEHYGVVPGTKKPSLWKAGAEKLCLLFRLDAQFETTEQYDGQHLTVRSKCTLFHIPSGQRVGSGEGLCSSKEKKYAYRKDGTPNENLPDVYNTVLKMANKRALVAATLVSTAASDIFTQDIEDMPVVLIDAQADVKESKPKDYKLRPQQPARQEDPDRVPASVTDAAAPIGSPKPDQGEEGGPDESVELVTLEACTKERDDKKGQRNRGLKLICADGSSEWWQCYEQESMDLAGKGKGKKFYAKLEDKNGFKLCHNLTEVANG